MSTAFDQVVAVTRENIKARKRSQAKAPNRYDLEKAFPGKVREETNPQTGKRDWVLSVENFDRSGNRTAEGKKLEAMMTPFARAESERARGMAVRHPAPVALKDADGSRRYVPPHLERDATTRNGWRSGARAQGSLVERGEGGMLWSLAGGKWRPLGVKCLGTPLVGNGRVSKRGLQHDPDGRPYRWISGRWRPLA